MTGLRGVGGKGGGGAVAAGGRVARGAGGFRVPGGGGATAIATAGAVPNAAAVGEVGLFGMLALQEVGGAPVGDRAARQHGHDMLGELAALQRALLGSDPGANLDRLGRLVAAVPVAADPALREAVAAITLRVRIELARRGRE